ncbi:MAG TPA: Rieske 2Fe-2S domain-containing protein [Mycobacteriales bacterium]|nr:Rieske 2Fe-2S domain-containing protein [Mycobacteriales bacterium]
MPSWVPAATLDELWEGEILGVAVNGVEVVLCNVEGTVVAYEDRCPHLANPLSAGVLEGGVLTCAAHEWSFDARTGDGVNPSVSCLRRFPVRIEDDRILVQCGAGTS